ncbi:prephenate dehydratase [Nakamurella flavida]|uniref:Prephenate dehydratase n=1 Tax=Nakamurella flavida TaxID=363630 RepID=A0A938YN66_9ACTN|nr:prephenate dehydratase [Nakamurella flavida]
MGRVTSTVRWAYLGPEGTFTEQAACELASTLPEPPELVSAAGVSAALAALRSGEVEAACVPLESSVEGAVPLTQDELIHGAPLMIVAEAYVPVTFDLLVRAGTSLDDVRTVGAHPHGLAQIRGWLADRLPAAQTVVHASNAAAAAAVAAGELDAAAAAPVAADTYGLIAAARDIGDVRDAVTRFVLLRRPGPPPAPTGNDRTSMMLSVDNEPGALLAVLSEFATRGVNLTRLESRPTRNGLGDYVFLVDAEGHIADPALADVAAALTRRGALPRLLGSYARRSGAAAPAARYATDSAYAAAARTVAQWQNGAWS